MSELLKRLEGLSPEKRNLLLKKLRQQNLVAEPTPQAQPRAIQPVPRTQPLPLSFPQRRLWFLDQFEPGTPAYNIPEFVRLVGPLHAQVLERCLNEVIRRHESLRTTFIAVDGEPVQRSAPELSIPLRVVDLEPLPAAEREARCRELAAEAAGTSFDLSRGPLLCATLVRLGPAEHVLLLVIHHIISDGWSTGILVRELATLYAAFSQGQPSPLPELAIQYADFAVWQQQWMQGEVLTTQVEYWRKQLAGGEAALSLPTDRPRPRVRSFAGGKVPFRVEPLLVERLRALGGQEKASLYMVLLAALQAQLLRYTREPRLSVGTYIANRNRAEVEPLIGFFLNTLVMRTDLSGDPTARELLRRVVEVTLGAYAHQDVPFEKLLEELAPARDTSISPFFQVMLVLQNTPSASVGPGALRLEPYEIPGETYAQFELTLWLSEEPDGLRGYWEYNRDLFDEATIHRMVAHYQELLAGIAARPDERLSRLPLLPVEERRRLLVEWNQTERAFPRACLHHLIEAHAARAPQAPAVVHLEQRLTYGELDRRANQLAWHLRSLGVGPGQIAGLCLERSVEMIVSVLAVLKAGGAYVPLDPSYPPERLALMLADSRPQVLVTRQALLSLLPGPLPRVVCVDAEAEALARQPDEAPEGGATEEDLAYVVYTSGSTGRPKGVMVTHGSLANAYHAWEQDYRLPELRAHLQMASFSFDVFAGDLARALGSGAALVLCPREWLLEPERLYALIRREQVECGEFVPAVVRLLMDYLEDTGQRLEPMRLVIVGSDTWELREYHRLRGLCSPGTRVVSSYGLSEATIDSTWYEDPAAVPSEQVVPIGRPFANTRLYLLDEHLQPVPVGVPGELYVGGPGLARGYWGQPELTAARFVPDPFSSQPGARLYRTGDMVRYLADGTLAFLGRNDSQVKIRGHRIELDEVKARLLEHPAVKGVELLVHEEAGNKQLVAWLTLKAPESATADSLRQYLRERLPPYMVPGAFLVLESFPLTPNGKVDRLALPRPELSQRERQEDFVAPGTEVERRLAALWEELLSVRPVGLHDNFFDLGGHSLLAVRLVARIREQFGRTLPLATLFQGATVAHLARVLTEEQGPRPWHPLVPIRAGGQRPPLFCVPGAGGNVLYFHDLAQLLGPEQPVYGLQARGLDGTSEPHGSVEEMAACYVEAIQQAQPRGPYLLLGHSFGSWVVFELAQQLARKGERVALVGILNTPIPLMQGTAEEEPAFDDAGWMASIASVVGRLYGADLGLSAQALRPLSPDERLEQLTRRLVEAGILPPGSDSLQVRGLVQVYKAAYRINYTPGETVPVPLILFRAQERHEEDGVLPAEVAEDAAWGWGRHAGRPVPVEHVPGDHMTMLARPHVQVLAERLRRHLELARGEGDT